MNDNSTSKPPRRYPRPANILEACQPEPQSWPIIPQWHPHLFSLLLFVVVVVVTVVVLSFLFSSPVHGTRLFQLQLRSLRVMEAANCQKEATRPRLVYCNRVLIFPAARNEIVLTTVAYIEGERNKKTLVVQRERESRQKKRWLPALRKNVIIIRSITRFDI